MGEAFLNQCLDGLELGLKVVDHFGQLVMSSCSGRVGRGCWLLGKLNFVWVAGVSPWSFGRGGRLLGAHSCCGLCCETQRVGVGVHTELADGSNGMPHGRVAIGEADCAVGGLRSCSSMGTSSSQASVSGSRRADTGGGASSELYGCRCRYSPNKPFVGVFGGQLPFESGSFPTA